MLQLGFQEDIEKIMKAIKVTETDERPEP